jgi:hypothetical protein
MEGNGRGMAVKVLIYKITDFTIVTRMFTSCEGGGTP